MNEGYRRCCGMDIQQGHGGGGLRISAGGMGRLPIAATTSTVLDLGDITVHPSDRRVNSS